MNTTLSTVDRRHEQPPNQVGNQPSTRIRVGLVDHVALRVGIALITWGRRPLAVESRERRANRVEHQLARLARERANERQLRLNLPVR